MKVLLASFLMLISYTKTYPQKLDINSLKNDPVLIEYKKIYNELKEASLYTKYKIPSDPNLVKDLARNPTKQGMINTLKTKGMINAEEYVNKIFLQKSLMIEFLKKHPELSKLSKLEKIELYGNLLDN